MALNNQVNNWLVIGIKENWETALTQTESLWGLKTHYQNDFRALNTGDIVWFYVTNPVSGIIGLGMVKDKYIDNTNLIWNDEVNGNMVIWPLRFTINVLNVINRERWDEDRIGINDFNLNWRIGFQPLREEYIIELNERAKNI